MTGNLVPKQGVDINGHPYTRMTRLDIPTDNDSRVISGVPAQAAKQNSSLYDGGDITYEGSHIKLFVSWDGEGYEGEYDEDDDSDIPLLRIDVAVRHSIYGDNRDDYDLESLNDDEWVVPGNAESSICTLVDARSSAQDIEADLTKLGESFNSDIKSSSLDVIPSLIDGFTTEMSRTSQFWSEF